LTTKPVPGLFERWFALERATDRSVGDILADLNTTAGTNYKHNWPSVVAGRNFELERCPVEVRRYMMRKVMAEELKGMGVELSKKKLELLIQCLT